MKKLLSLIIAIAMIFGFSTQSFATETSNVKDYEALIHGLCGLDLSHDNVQMDYLYDANGTLDYMLGTTSSTYIILEKETYMILEAGEGNPFHGFMDQDKYYGGPLCYYAKDKDATQFYDIVQEKNVDGVSELVRVDSVDASQRNMRGVTATTYKRVANYTSYIKKRAFGWNNNNTCSAVALGLALNYLTLQYGNSYVPSSWSSELRTASTETSTSYPNAQSLHNYLVNSCGMTGPCYGNSLQSGFNVYKYTKIPSSYSISLSWTLSPAINTIKTKIDNNLPVLITTTTGNPDSSYNWHTMLVYGYKVTDGTTMYLIHNGWYGSSYNSYSGGVHIQNEVWYNPTYATYGYYFTLN